MVAVAGTRVFGAITAGAFLGMPLGGLVAGYLLEAVGLRFALLATGGCYLLTTLSLILNKSLRHMDTAAAPGEDSRISTAGAV